MKQAILTIAILGISALPAIAADDFGARFTGQAPIGFTDVSPNDDAFNMDDFDPNSIEPAAGDADEAPELKPELNNEPSPQDTPVESSQTEDEISL